MKKMKKLSCSLLMLFFLMIAVVFPVHADDDDHIKPKKISAVTSKTITVTKGKEFELKVRMIPGNADDDRLRWSIVSGKTFVRFDDDDRNDDDIELKAVKTGTAKIRCTIRGTKKKVTFTVKVKAPKKNNSKSTIIKVGTLTKTLKTGEEFELKVKKSKGLKDKYLLWSIEDSSIVRFDDDDRYDDEMEFKAKKAGTTKISCKNTQTGKSITYTITVTPKKADWDDDWDDDDDDDRDDDWDDDDDDDRDDDWDDDDDDDRDDDWDDDDRDDDWDDDDDDDRDDDWDDDDDDDWDD